MSPRRGESGLSGILLVDKPQGLTSHDVVNRVRRVTGERRVGHAGTLDPMASGLLVVLVGPATRLAPFLTSAEKSYLARITFGEETDTDDAEGRVVRTSPVPSQLFDFEFAAGAVSGLVGTHEQVPPAFSAIKKGGVTAYHAARKGEELELEPRAVEISAACLVDVGDRQEPYWDVELTVSKGTYIRAIARDLGRDMGTAAHLSALRRTHAGEARIEDALGLEEVESVEAGEVPTLFSDPLPLLGMPVVRLNEAGVQRVMVGAPLDVTIHCDDETSCEGPIAVAENDLLLAVYTASGDIMKPVAVIPGGVRGERS